MDIEELGNKAVFCRCWRSSKVMEKYSLVCVGEDSKERVLVFSNSGIIVVVAFAAVVIILLYLIIMTFI